MCFTRYYICATDSTEKICVVHHLSGKEMTLFYGVQYAGADECHHKKADPSGPALNLNQGEMNSNNMNSCITNVTCP
ncbi:hypothetical protein BSQ33_05020 [Vibrio gazogenes]|uniref:Uncharacterized protein n=1 Tax=Vibrio gazogenes TaxID=687 RepID=A0A1Z2SDA8_VIBGA|nr:hypothetical protein BSQ33_05020 [Vibrio gazogenes]